MISIHNCSAEDTVIPANGKGLVKTDLAIAIPRGTYARVAPRSGLALKHFIDTGAGVVDEDYRGNVGVVLFNHGSSDFKGKVALGKLKFDVPLSPSTETPQHYFLCSIPWRPHSAAHPGTYHDPRGHRSRRPRFDGPRSWRIWIDRCEPVTERPRVWHLL